MLEREILEIKMKLQGSSIGPGGQDHQQNMISVEEGSQEFNREANLAQSMGSTMARGRDNGQSSQMATGTFHPAQSMSAQHQYRSGVYHD